MNDSTTTGTAAPRSTASIARCIAMLAALWLPQALAMAHVTGMPLAVALLAFGPPAAVFSVSGATPRAAIGPVYALALLACELGANLAPYGSLAYYRAVQVISVEAALFLLMFGVLRVGRAMHLINRAVMKGTVLGSAVLVIASQLPVLAGNPVAPARIDLVHLVGLWSGMSFTHQALWLGVAVLAALVGLSPLRASARWWSPLLPAAVVVLGAALLAVPALAPYFQATLATRAPEVGIAQLLGSTAIWWRAIPGALLVAGLSYFLTQAAGVHDARSNRLFVQLGVANLAGAAFGGFPVAGSPRRREQLNHITRDLSAHHLRICVYVWCGLVTALAVLTPYAPAAAAVCCAAIAVWSSWETVFQVNPIASFRFNALDAATGIGTAVAVVLFGIAVGIVVGFLMSMAAFLHRAGHPGIVELGRLANGHFRSRARYESTVFNGILVLRVDDNVTFANARAIEERVAARTRSRQDLRYLILVCNGINFLDLSGLASLERIQRELASRGITLCFADAKENLSVQLQSGLKLSRVYPSTQEAIADLTASSDIASARPAPTPT